MDIAILVTELSKPEYASMTDQQAADAVNAKTVAVRVLVPNWQMKQHAILGGYWPLVKAGQLDSDPQKAGLCLSVIDWIDDPKISNTDMDLAGVQTMIAGLVAFGLITQSQANELDALADSTVRWVDSVGIGTVGDGHVVSAREIIGA